MTEATVGTEARPLRVAIIGAGPSGFFSAAAFLGKKQKDVQVTVDLFDKLPAPYGLVRYGVAPDHPEIKRVRKAYDKTASDPRFRYFGNVEFGTDVTLEELRQHYDQVLFTSGAQSDRALNIPGEDLEGSYSATEFVAWYNSHPEYADRTFDLSHPNVVVVGVGNVAMDVARVLAKSVAELQPTDIAEHTLAALADSKVKNIYVLGRRGPVQAKFTNPELKEFRGLELSQPIVLERDLELDPASAAALEGDKMAQRNMNVLREFAAAPVDETKVRKVLFRFLTSPVEIHGTDGRVSGITLRRNRLEPSESGYINSVATDETETIPCGLVLRSVGYKGVALPGVPYNSRRGTIPNEEGRVVDPDNDNRPVDGVYVAGWAKRGPSGVIGTNKSCANDTVKSMLADATTVTPAVKPDPANIVSLLEARSVKFISFADWLKIDALENERGEQSGRAKVKIVRTEDMLAAVQK